MEFKIKPSGFAGSSLPEFSAKTISDIGSLFPDLDSIDHSTPFIFKLNTNSSFRRGKGKRKNKSRRDALEALPDGIHFEASVDMVNGETHLNVEDQDMKHIQDILDFNNNKKLELDWLSGSIVTLSKKYNIKCPTHREIVEGIKKKLNNFS